MVEVSIDSRRAERARRIEALQGNRNPFIWGEAPLTPPPTPAVVASANGAIIGNKKSKIYHRPDCSSAAKVSPQHRVRFTTEAEAQAAGIGWRGIVHKSFSQGIALRESLLRLSTCQDLGSFYPLHRTTPVSGKIQLLDLFSSVLSRGGFYGYP